MTDQEQLAFVEFVRSEEFRLAMLIEQGRGSEAGKAALSLCSTAAQKKRALLGLPEPDPERDYDEDYDLSALATVELIYPTREE